MVVEIETLKMLLGMLELWRTTYRRPNNCVKELVDGALVKVRQAIGWLQDNATEGTLPDREPALWELTLEGFRGYADPARGLRQNWGAAEGKKVEPGPKAEGGRLLTESELAEGFTDYGGPVDEGRGVGSDSGSADRLLADWELEERKAQSE